MFKLSLSLFLNSLLAFMSFLISSVFFLNKNFFSFKDFLIVLFFLYLLTNLFFFFSTQYQYSKYTSFVKFFWQRSFILFWLLEFYLFSVFLYILFFCPNETKYFFDYIKQNEISFSNNFDFLSNLVILSVLIYLLNRAIFNFKNSSLLKSAATFILLTPALLTLFLREVFQFKDSVNQTNFNFFKNMMTFQGSELSFIKTNFFNQNYSLSIQRPNDSLFLFLIVIKFLHVLLIALHYLFVLSKALTNTTTKESLSAAITNTNYILVFYILNFAVFFKPIIIFFLTKKYYFIMQDSTTGIISIFTNELLLNIF